MNKASNDRYRISGYFAGLVYYYPLKPSFNIGFANGATGYVFPPDPLISYKR